MTWATTKKWKEIYETYSLIGSVSVYMSIDAISVKYSLMRCSCTANAYQAADKPKNKLTQSNDSFEQLDENITESSNVYADVEWTRSYRSTSAVFNCFSACGSHYEIPSPSVCIHVNINDVKQCCWVCTDDNRCESVCLPCTNEKKKKKTNNYKNGRANVSFNKTAGTLPISSKMRIYSRYEREQWQC